MQIPLLQPLGSIATNLSSQRQPVELAQSVNGDAAAAVVPNTAQAVAAVAQGQAQEQSKNALSSRKPQPKELEDALKQLNDVAKLYNSQLEFSVDKSTNIEVVKVIDKDTQKVIRQIPSEDAIRIAKAIGDFKGLLLKEQA